MAPISAELAQRSGDVVRIALVCPYDLGRFGGVQDQTLRLADWLRGEGHHAWVVGPGEGPEGTVSVGGTVVLNANGSSTPIALTPAVAGRVRDAVTNADVVHIHEPLMPVVSLGATIAVRQPSVGTFHADIPWWVRPIYRVAFGLSGGGFARLNAITAVSPVASAALGPHVERTVVPNGLDTATFAHGPKEPGRVVFLGRDDPRKGLDTFTAAAAVVSSRIAEVDFVVAGTDERKAIGPVSFIGRPSEDEKRQLLASAEVFVAPHRGGESFGMVVAEAMAAGCAVVASALPAFAHVLGDAGVLVPPGDPLAVADAVTTLLENERLRRDYQERALTAVRRFDRTVVVAGYMGAYETALRRSR